MALDREVVQGAGLWPSIFFTPDRRAANFALVIGPKIASLESETNQLLKP